MSGTAYVLYVDDPLAGPALELLRWVVQPASKSLPHITVLYARTEMQDHGTRIYDDFVTDRITLAAPGSFDAPSDSGDGLSTLFLRCESSQLEFLHHKPDFPDSFLHISLYDGDPSPRASEALEVLKAFSWNLEVPLPNGRLRPLRAGRSTRANGLTRGAANLLNELADGALGADDLATFDWSRRRTLLTMLASYLHENLPEARPRRRVGIESAITPGGALSQQEELWPAIDFLDPERASAARSPDAEAHRRGGVFLTPPELAFDITRAALRNLPLDRGVTFGDPSIGSGIFLASLVNLAGPESIASAIGVESDPLRAHLTHDRWRSVGLDVAIGDFVEGMVASPPRETGRDQNGWRLNRRNLVLANPPYVRSQLLDFERASRWRRALTQIRGIDLSERSDLYVYFILAAHEWMSDGAIAAWLIPTEFMFTNYGSAVRRYLTSQVTLLSVHSYDGPSKFSNARVTSCAVIFRNASPPPGHLVTFTAGGILSDSYVSSTVELQELTRTEKWHFIADDGIATGAVEPSVTLGDLFSVKRGIATGSNQHFLLESHAVTALAVPSAWLLPVISRARHLPGPVIEADSDGNPMIPGVRWLIDVDLKLDAIDAEAPRFAAYLRSIEPEVRERTIVKRRRTFYRQEQSSAPRFLFSYMARDGVFGNRFFLNRSRAVILNNYLGLYPKPALQAWLDLSPENELALLDILKSIRPSELARAGRVYVEGLTKVEPRELARLSISNLPLSVLDALAPSREG